MAKSFYTPTPRLYTPILKTRKVFLNIFCKCKDACGCVRRLAFRIKSRELKAAMRDVKIKKSQNGPIR